MKKIVISISLILFLTSCNTKTSISTDFLISSGKWCGFYDKYESMTCFEFLPNGIRFSGGEKEGFLGCKYEKVNDSIIYIFPSDGGKKSEIYLKSKDTINIDGEIELSTNGYTSPE